MKNKNVFFLERAEKSFFAVLSICAIALFVLSCEFRKTNSKVTVLDALDAVSDKNADWKKAKSLAEKAVKQNPDDQQARILLAVALEQNGQIASATDELKKAVKLDGSNFLALYTLGRIYFESDKYGDCLSPFVQANKLEPANGAAVYYLARTYAKLGRTEDALAKFKQLAKFSDFKSRPEPLNEIGVLLVEKKDYKNALAYLVAAHRIAPENHKVIWNLAVFYDKFTRNPSTAISFYNKYQEVTLINPELEPRRTKARERIKALSIKAGRG
jgi:Flp pilus assembly protein TadD